MANYIVTHWKGENSLAWAFWINLFLIPHILIFVELWIHERLAILATPLGGIVSTVLYLLVFAWGLTGTWRSATKSIDHAEFSHPRKTTFWAYTAKLVIIVEVTILFTGSFVLQ